MSTSFCPAVLVVSAVLVCMSNANDACKNNTCSDHALDETAALQVNIISPAVLDSGKELGNSTISKAPGCATDPCYVAHVSSSESERLCRTGPVCKTNDCCAYRPGCQSGCKWGYLDKSCSPPGYGNCAAAATAAPTTAPTPAPTPAPAQVPKPTTCANFQCGDKYLKPGFVCDGSCDADTCCADQCDYQCYLDRYENLKKVFGNNLAGAEAHYQKFGKNEGKLCTCPPPECDWGCYLSQNAGVAAVVGAGNFAGAQRHYEKHGAAEGRSCACAA